MSWNSQMRRPGMAIACMGAITLSVFGMYFVGLDTRAKEGNATPYNTGRKGSPTGSDKRMDSADVSAAVSVPKPTSKERLRNQN